MISARPFETDTANDWVSNRLAASSTLTVTMFAPCWAFVGVQVCDAFLISTRGEFITRPSESVRTARFKYIETDAPSGITQELYDLEVDPYETTNRILNPADAAVVEAMIDRLEALLGPAPQ